MRAVKRVEGRTTTDNSANGRRAALATVVVLNVGAILVGVSLVRLIGRHLVPATVGEIDERPVGDVNVGWDALWEAGVVAAYVRRRAVGDVLGERRPVLASLAVRARGDEVVKQERASAVARV